MKDKIFDGKICLCAGFILGGVGGFLLGNVIDNYLLGLPIGIVVGLIISSLFLGAV